MTNPPAVVRVILSSAGALGFLVSPHRFLLAFHRALGLVLVGSLLCSLGCKPELPKVRDIQRKREQQSGEFDKYDQLSKAMDFVSQLGQVDAEAGADQVSSLLSTWLKSQQQESGWKGTQLIASLPADMQQDVELRAQGRASFLQSDARYLQANYLLAAIARWVQNEAASDPLFMPWIDAQKGGRFEIPQRDQLAKAAILFDWTVRNLQLLPNVLPGEAPPGPSFPWGLQFRGAGYRQTLLETLYRGQADRLQRGRVFMQLCRQVGIPAYMLVLPGKESNPDAYWAVGTLVGNELYLFEPGLGIPVPGSGQTGIATFTEAKNDPTILRRLNVPGWFDYPWDAKQVASSVALIDVEPEAMTWRMQRLEESLASDQRMITYADVDRERRALIEVGGIEIVRLWPLAMQARAYQRVLQEAMQVDQQLAIWESFQWGALTGTFPLAMARWDHLRGQFERVDEKAGARVNYLEQRLPEYDIERLRGDVDLQKSYGVRRELGDSQEFYDFRIQQVQHFMRLSKRAATYWLSLIHYDTGDFQNAKNWFEKRVLVDDLESTWKSGARYNLARTLEKLGDSATAIELLKTIGDPQEHGNRIRARLLERQSGEGEGDG